MVSCSTETSKMDKLETRYSRLKRGCLPALSATKRSLSHLRSDSAAAMDFVSRNSLPVASTRRLAPRAETYSNHPGT